MSNKQVNLMWKSFKGLRRLNTINSASELGADNLSNVRLSKEKAGQDRSIKTSGWFETYTTLTENVIRLFPASLSGYAQPNQLIAITKTSSNINAYIVEDDTGILASPIKIAAFPVATEVTDICQTQFGDRICLVCAFGNNTLGFSVYSATSLTGWTDLNNGWFYRTENIIETTTTKAVTNITQVAPYGSRLAINGHTEYVATHTESIYGVWFSEAGNPISFTATYLSSATDTSAFYVETGEQANKLIEYNGLVAFCKNKTINISGTTQNDITVQTLTSKGVVGNAAFVINGQCAYVDSYAQNVFILSNNIDGTIGFDSPIGNDIQDYLSDIKNVSLNSIDRRVRMIKASGEALVYDIDIGEWTIENFNADSFCVTFLNKEIMCDKTTSLKRITTERKANSQLKADANGIYSSYKTNLIWLDSQTSVKSHIYPFAIILEPQTNNDFFIKLTTDRKDTVSARITRSGYVNIATYSQDDNVPTDGSKFVSSDDDLTGRIFFSMAGNELLVTVNNPSYWRYLQMEIYTTSANMEYNISGIEAKNTFITDEQLDY